MKKALLIMICLMLVGCSNNEINSVTDNNNQITATDVNEAIYVWRYDATDEIDDAGEIALNKIRQCAEIHDINMEIAEYHESEITREDFALKRNAALATGKLDIIIDSPLGLYSVRNRAGDYTKLSTYNNIIADYSNNYCIPLYLYSFAWLINESVLDSFNMDGSSVVTDVEYFDLKQAMKANGAVFKLNGREADELIN